VACCYASTELPTHASARAACRAIDRVSNAKLGALGPHSIAALEGHLDPAALIDTTAWAVDIGKSDFDSANLAGVAPERKTEAPLHQALDGFREG